MVGAVFADGGEVRDWSGAGPAELFPESLLLGGQRTDLESVSLVGAWVLEDREQ